MLVKWRLNTQGQHACMPVRVVWTSTSITNVLVELLLLGELL